MGDLLSDLHTHTTYSDGYDAHDMGRAAADAGLELIGFTDHCLPYEDPFGRSDQYDFDETYDRRRRDNRALRDDADLDVEILDGVELNYDPNHEAAIRAFLAEAEFDYVIRSVHYAETFYAAHPEDLADASPETRRAAIDAYVGWQVQLVKSGLFDVLVHPDVTQRSSVLRGEMTETHYRRLADALTDSRTGSRDPPTEPTRRF